MKPLICKLRGHRWNDAAQQNGVNHCDFCGYSDWGIHSKGFGEWTLRDEVEHRLWAAKHKLRFWWDCAKAKLNRKD